MVSIKNYIIINWFH